MNHLLERIKAPLATAASRQEPGGGCLARSSAELARVGCNMLALPFDIARAQYAKAVQLGLIERSLIASARFGQMLNALEKLTLGPLARKY